MGRPLLFDLTGQRYGRLTVVAQAPKQHNTTYWLCECDCGATCAAGGRDLRKGRTKSCGCYEADRKVTHGLSKAPIYRVWIGMRQRCENPKTIGYKNYGGRGIKVCKRWHTFENFVADMGHRPKGYTLDRINNDKGYSPENCRWATRRQQHYNYRGNQVVEFNGQRHPLKEWARILGVDYDMLRHRIVRAGWPVDLAFNTPATGKVRYARRESVEFQGKTYKLIDLAKAYEINPRIVRERIKRSGWSLKEALTTPIRPRAG
jgi:hypothetical protein